MNLVNNQNTSIVSDYFANYYNSPLIEIFRNALDDLAKDSDTKCVGALNHLVNSLNETWAQKS